ncbi:TetR/AcrR family transcriptional regulator [Nocardiopsis suaedae]|uniref:Helix-turn-helix domain containing protein n=1 Tax=Nocardiopsis suaedae TaxID=3018444 RepID=A0ABT4TJ65_9ACTN|nr:TetR/AcrR family transcriptional regulator [Nocardiopsis suaedae]MDA2804744.1 helix-turn-helix domain containing protein [Nocardiopsis suaedae]
MDRWSRTHEALRRAALELFTEDGYDAASTARIAERAGVSEMTLFRHFPSKDALLLADPFDPLMAEAVRARPAEEPPMRALAEGIRRAWAGIDADSARDLRIRLRIIAEASSLHGALERNSGETIAALAGALAKRGAAAAPARAAATAMVSGLSVALLEWARSERSSLDDALGRALDVLGGG